MAAAQELYGQLPANVYPYPSAAMVASVPTQIPPGMLMSAANQPVNPANYNAAIQEAEHKVEQAANTDGKDALVDVGLTGAKFFADNKAVVSGAATAAGEAAKHAANDVVHTAVNISPLAMGAGAAIDTFSAFRNASKGTEKMLEAYRPIVAAKLGIPPEQVDEKALNLAADDIPQLKDALDVLGVNKAKAPIIGLGNTGAFAAATMLGPAGWMAIPVGMAASLVSDKIGSVLLGKRELEDTLVGKIEALNGKLAGGELLSQVDLAGIYMAKHGELALQMENALGKPWEDASLKEQAEVLTAPRFTNLAATTRLVAGGINAGTLSAEQVMVLEPDEIEAMVTQGMAGYQQGMQVMQSVPAAVGQVPTQFAAPAQPAATRNVVPFTRIATQGHLLAQGRVQDAVAQQAVPS